MALLRRHRSRNSRRNRRVRHRRPEVVLTRQADNDDRHLLRPQLDRRQQQRVDRDERQGGRVLPRIQI